jgi:hypothetical protein
MNSAEEPAFNVVAGKVTLEPNNAEAISFPLPLLTIYKVLPLIAPPLASMVTAKSELEVD